MDAPSNRSSLAREATLLSTAAATAEAQARGGSRWQEIRPARWYDADESLSLAMKLLEVLPHQQRKSILEQVNTQLVSLLEEHAPEEAGDNETALAQRKAQHRFGRRWYDSDLQIHYLMEHWRMLPKAAQQFCGQQLLRLLEGL